MADNKPSLADSLKTIGKAITDEVEKHGGVQGLATETFEAAKTGAGKAIDALSKAADDASKYASAKSDEFQRKYNEYKNASNEEDKDTATDDAAVLAEWNVRRNWTRKKPNCVPVSLKSRRNAKEVKPSEQIIRNG